MLWFRCFLPFIDVVRLEYINSINVRDVEDGLVAGRVGQLHQDFIEEHRLGAKVNTIEWHIR